MTSPTGAPPPLQELLKQLESEHPPLPSLESIETWMDFWAEREPSGSEEVFVFGLWSDQFPLKAVLGYWDWHMEGALSRAVQQGYLTGASDEIALYPAKLRSRQLPLLLMGLGRKDHPIQRDALTTQLALLAHKLEKLKAKKAIFSRSSFPLISPRELRKIFHSLELSFGP